MKGKRIRNKAIEESIELEAAVLNARYRGVDESRYYERLAEKIISEYYCVKDEEDRKPREELGVQVLGDIDDHGYVDEKALEEGIKTRPDFILFGGDHSARTVELIGEATMGIPKYALLGNHDSQAVEQAFRKVGAQNIHGKIIETKQGIVIGGFHGSHLYKEDRRGRTLLTQYESLQIARGMITELQRRGTGLDLFFSHDKALVKAFDPSLFYNDGASHCGLIGNTLVAAFHDIHEGIYPAQYHIHGHLHQRYTREHENGQIERCMYEIEVLKL